MRPYQSPQVADIRGATMTRTKTVVLPDDLTAIWQSLGVPLTYEISRADWLLACLVAALRLIKQLQAELAELKKEKTS
jgi:hypothetical protein